MFNLNFDKLAVVMLVNDNHSFGGIYQIWISLWINQRQ